MGYQVTAVIINVLLTFIFACGAAYAFLMYRARKTLDFAAFIAIFLSYLIDNAIVFCTEIIPPFADIYDRMFLQTPSIKTVCFIIRISSMLFLLHRVMPSFKQSAVLTLTALHAFSLICAPLIHRPDWMVYIYYFFSQFIIISVSAWGLLNLKRNADKYDLKRYTFIKRILLYFLIMAVLVLLEDTYVIFFVDVYTSTGLNIFNRNFSENLLFAGFAIAFIIYTIRSEDELIQLATAAADDQSHKSADLTDPIGLFASRFNLTDRELEILRHVLDGKSQQEISQILIIALGTVKTHTHNIYSKVGAANRSQILQKYQDFLEQMNADATVS